MAAVEQTPVLPFRESKEEGERSTSLKTDMFTAVQEATFKQVQMSQHRGVSNPDNIKCIISQRFICIGNIEILIQPLKTLFTL